MKQEIAQRILRQTRETYDRIAADFDATRNYLWPESDQFLQYLKPGATVLDIGCGNGRLVRLFEKFPVDYTGIDSSVELLKLARAKHPGRNFVFGDALQLPFAEAQFDAVFLIAVLHHIPSRRLRHQVLREVWRVLKPGGIFIMTNWDCFSRPLERKLIAKFTVQKIISQSQLDFKDILKPWAHSGLQRYCHCFTMGEMRRAVRRAGFKIKASFRTTKKIPDAPRNLVVVAEK